MAKKHHTKSDGKGCLTLLVIYTVQLFVTYFLLDKFYFENQECGKVFPNHSSYFYVSDFSHVLTSETEKYIYTQGKLLEDATTAQAVVVTVPSPAEMSLEAFSLQLGNQWKIGQKDKDNGILLTFTTKSPHVRLEVGKGLEGYIPDAKAGRILDNYAVNDKNKKLWNRAVWNTYTAVLFELYNDYDKEPPLSLTYTDMAEPAPEDSTAADLNYEDIKTETYGTTDNPDKITSKHWYSALMAPFLMPFWLIFNILFGFHGELSSGSGGGSYSGSYGSSYSSSSSRSSYSSGGSSGGGRSGGGGSFGGGGASR